MHAIILGLRGQSKMSDHLNPAVEAVLSPYFNFRPVPNLKIVNLECKHCATGGMSVHYEENPNSPNVRRALDHAQKHVK